MGRTARKTPDRWEKYSAIGKVIEGTRFIAFKTPLKPELSTRIGQDHHFNINTLLFKIAELGGQLGLVIDLTNTDRYYDRSDVETLDIAYTKLYCPGHEVNGREDIVKQFIKRVDKFLSDNDDNDMWIGVHCTHGINRTGYLISRYLIDRQEWTSHAALEAFEKARGYPIERGNYVQSLHAAAKNRKSSTKRHSRKSPVVVSEDDNVASEEEKLSAAKRSRRTEQQKTKKHDISTVPNATEMQQMWQMMMKTLAPTTSAAAAGPGNPLNMFNVDNTPKPPIDKPPVKPEEMDDGDEEEDDEEDDGEPEYPVILGDEADEAGGSKSKKRRVRRKNLQKMFDKMKRGQFWEIQEMQKEKYGLK